MKKFFKSLALVPRGLRYKLIIIFCLMSIIPILALLYIISTYVFPITETIGNLMLTIGLSIFIAILGFILAGSIINPIIKMAKNARGLVEGELVSELPTEEREDEIGDLSTSLNLLTSRLNRNMSELKNYEQKIREINMEINKKILALSTLFQVGNIMSSAADLNVILQFIVEKAYELIGSEKAFLMLIDIQTNELVVKAVRNIKTEDVDKMRVRVTGGALGKIVEENKTFVVDASHKPPGNLRDFLTKYELKNVIIAPIIMRLKPIGLIACGNNLNGFSYHEDDIELINIFAKQASIAVENDMLLAKTEELAIKDDLTGLYNINYLKTRLEEEIQRAIAYQRPCSFILIDIDDFKIYDEKNGKVAAEAVLRKIAQILEKNIEQVDRVARYADEEFAIICPEKNKMEALSIAENIRKEIENFNFPHAESQPKRKITISVGVSANPLDGITPDELIATAYKRLKQAKVEGKNKVVA
jgi:diguanylate cyclase (GGDEF)-like protein